MPPARYPAHSATTNRSVADRPLGAPTLGHSARIFAAHASPRIIALALLATVAARIAVARWSWWDLIAPGAFIAAQPFTEWGVHVVLLHFRPRRIGRLTVDPLAARKHRAHHLDPRDVSLVFIPLPDLLAVILGAGLIWLLPAPLPIGLSALMGIYAVLLAYEWAHYLIHSSYRPRHALYRSIWRSHRNHHFRNEHYWFGITTNVADHLLKTNPDRSAVEPSPTARTLGVDVAT